MSRRRKKNSNKGSDFLKFSIAIAMLAIVPFYFKDKSLQKSKTPSLPSVEKIVKTESKKAESLPTEVRIQRSKALTGLLPEKAWQDDYLVLKTHLGKSNSDLYLLGVGIASDGNPEKIQDPLKLKPLLIVAKKEGESFVKISDFDFKTKEPSIGGLQQKNLKGIPRIKSADIIDLEGNGMPEIKVSFDTSTELAEAIGFLKWNGSELEWLRTKDSKGEEKIALWLSGASSSDSQQIELKKVGNTYEIIQRFGQVNSQHPEKGFEWKNTTWKMKNGTLQAL